MSDDPKNEPASEAEPAPPPPAPPPEPEKPLKMETIIGSAGFRDDEVTIRGVEHSGDEG